MVVPAKPDLRRILHILFVLQLLNMSFSTAVSYLGTLVSTGRMLLSNMRVEEGLLLPYQLQKQVQ